MKTYMVCFNKYNDKNNCQVYKQFSTIEKAEKCLIEISKRYKNELVQFPKKQNENEPCRSFTISMENFYNSEEYKDKFDWWFIVEGNIE